MDLVEIRKKALKDQKAEDNSPEEPQQNQQVVDPVSVDEPAPASVVESAPVAEPVSDDVKSEELIPEPEPSAVETVAEEPCEEDYSEAVDEHLSETTSENVNLDSGRSEDKDLDPLEALFQQGTEELELATEENYFDGLLGAGRSVEDDTKQLLSFMLTDEEYAVGIGSVREIIKVKEVTEIPRVPDYILGLISLRGMIIPVFDLNRRLKLGSAKIGNQTRIVVCQQGESYAGLLVDRINQVVKISEDKLEAAPSILSTLDRDFVKGIGRLQGRMIILLDLENVMAVK